MEVIRGLHFSHFFFLVLMQVYLPSRALFYSDNFKFMLISYILKIMIIFFLVKPASKLHLIGIVFVLFESSL